MKHFYLVSTIFFTFFTFAAAQKTNTNQYSQKPSSTQDELIKIVREELDALKTGDPAKVKAIIVKNYLENAISISVAGKVEDAKDLWKDLPPVAKISYELSNAQVRQAGDTATLFYNIVVFIEFNGRKLATGGYKTTTFVRQKGSWKILADHNSVPMLNSIVPLVNVDPKILESYTGKYEFRNRDGKMSTATISGNGDRLVLNNSSDDKEDLFPISETDFISIKSRVEISFAKDSSGNVLHYSVNTANSGGKVIWNKVK